MLLAGSIRLKILEAMWLFTSWICGPSGWGRWVAGHLKLCETGLKILQIFQRSSEFCLTSVDINQHNCLQVAQADFKQRPVKNGVPGFCPDLNVLVCSMDMCVLWVCRWECVGCPRSPSSPERSVVELHLSFGAFSNHFGTTR